MKRERFWVNHKRVLRLMRESDLLCRTKRSFVRTTDSDHPYPVYPNIYQDVIITGADQVWVADITYIRLLHDFVYLAVILDAYSRRVVGWALSRHIDAALTCAALRAAITERNPSAGCIHHSDRGVQYAAEDYIEVLKEHGFTISMSRKGNPYDNAQAESFMKTLKVEEVYVSEYRTFEEVKERIGEFIERYTINSGHIRHLVMSVRWSLNKRSSRPNGMYQFRPQRVQLEGCTPNPWTPTPPIGSILTLRYT